MTGSFSSFCTTVEIVCWKHRHGTSVRPTSKGIRLAQWHPQHIKMRPCALTYLTSAAKQEIERRNVWCCMVLHQLNQLQKPKPDTVEFGSCHILQSACPAACGQHKRSAQTETRHRRQIQKNQKVSKYDAWYKCVQIMVQRYPFLDRWCTQFPCLRGMSHHRQVLGLPTGSL